MREILFRGKDIRGNWHIGLLAHVGNAWYISNKAGIATAFEVIPNTIGQYTGITDDNGKKIFEGDILGVTNDDPDYDYITKVYLDCDTLCVDVEGQDYDYTAIGFAVDIWGDECDRVEIIGNIYDNPELLEV